MPVEIGRNARIMIGENDPYYPSSTFVHTRSWIVQTDRPIIDISELSKVGHWGSSFYPIDWPAEYELKEIVLVDYIAGKYQFLW